MGFQNLGQNSVSYMREICDGAGRMLRRVFSSLSDAADSFRPKSLVSSKHSVETDNVIMHDMTDGDAEFEMYDTDADSSENELQADDAVTENEFEEAEHEDICIETEHEDNCTEAEHENMFTETEHDDHVSADSEVHGTCGTGFFDFLPPMADPVRRGRAEEEHVSIDVESETSDGSEVTCGSFSEEDEISRIYEDVSVVCDTCEDVPDVQHVINVTFDLGVEDTTTEFVLCDDNAVIDAADDMSVSQLEDALPPKVIMMFESMDSQEPYTKGSEEVLIREWCDEIQLEDASETEDAGSLEDAISATPFDAVIIDDVPSSSSEVGGIGFSFLSCGQETEPMISFTWGDPEYDYVEAETDEASSQNDGCIMVSSPSFAKDIWI